MDTKDMDPRYVAQVPEGYIHWDNVLCELEGTTIAERVQVIQEEHKIPLGDILLSEFIPDDGYNKPMKVIFVRDVHVEKARWRDLQIRAKIEFLKDLLKKENGQ